MTRLVLLEHAPATFRPEPGDTVVAMTPEACYELDRRGIAYKLTTDFGIESRLAALEPLHWQEQLEWLDSFDEFLVAQVPATARWRFGAATLYGFNLKTLLDPVRVRALEVDSMLDSCDRVLLHRRAEGDPPVSWRLLFQGPSVTSVVLPLVARGRGIAFEERLDEETPALVGIHELIERLRQTGLGFLDTLEELDRPELRQSSRSAPLVVRDHDGQGRNPEPSQFAGGAAGRRDGDVGLGGDAGDGVGRRSGLHPPLQRANRAFQLEQNSGRS